MRLILAISCPDLNGGKTENLLVEFEDLLELWFADDFSLVATIEGDS